MASVSGIALSGIAAATLKLSASASNLANIDDVSAVGSVGYQPAGVEDTAQPGGGVQATAVTLKPATYLAYEPDSPLANTTGLISMPQIDPIAEIANQIEGSEAYAFQLKTFQVADDEQQALLDMSA
jgi:flagellar basal-body rod protein FlgC